MSFSQPSLSVGIPAHNEEKTIEVVALAILSICNRLLSENHINNFEVVFLDDASTDKTGEIIDKVSELSPRIKKISTTVPSGIDEVFNKLTNHLEHQWIIIVPADNQWDGEALTLLVDEWISSGCSQICLSNRANKSQVYRVLRKITSNIFNFIASNLIGQKSIDAGSVKITLNSKNYHLKTKGVVSEIEKLIISRNILKKPIRTIDVPWKPRSAGKEKGINSKVLILAGIQTFKLYYLNSRQKISDGTKK